MSPFEDGSYPQTDLSEATTPIDDDTDGNGVTDLSNWTFERPPEIHDSLKKVSNTHQLFILCVYIAMCLSGTADRA